MRVQVQLEHHTGVSGGRPATQFLDQLGSLAARCSPRRIGQPLGDRFLRR